MVTAALGNGPGQELPGRLVEWLAARDAAPRQSLQQALALAGSDGESFPRLLARLGIVAEADIARALADLTGAEVLDRSAFPEQALFPGRLSAKFLRLHAAVPIGDTGADILVAVAWPQDDYVVRALEMALERPVRTVVGTVSDIDAAITRLYEQRATAFDTLTAAVTAGFDDDTDIDRLRDLASEAPIVRLVNYLIARAVDIGASDVHIEPFEHSLKVRYRVDGVLQDAESPPQRSSAAVVSRIKLLAGLDIAERRLPQDGRLMLRVNGREIDMRVSAVPTLHGESVVLRVLDREQVTLDFAALGFDPELERRVRAAIELPHGILLVTGPTGSGKTTTLYTALSSLNSPGRKLLTVEDPVEYQIEGINQIQVKPQIGLTFASALRSIVRQDPDVIMVGEMRDLETARIAVQSALTGHVVLSTLHTNDAGSSITRLLDMGIEDYLVASTVNGVLAQRLARRLCPQCRRAGPPVPGMLERLRRQGYADDADCPGFCQPVGCPACGGTGYRGRIAILEFLQMEQALRERVLARADSHALQAAAIAAGMRSMKRDGYAKAVAGRTSIEDVLRVTQDTFE